MVLIQKVAPTMRIMKMFADCRIVEFSNTLKMVKLGGAADLNCTAQITYKMINNTLLIGNWRLGFFRFKILF